MLMERNTQRSPSRFHLFFTLSSLLPVDIIELIASFTIAFQGKFKVKLPFDPDSRICGIFYQTGCPLIITSRLNVTFFHPITLQSINTLKTNIYHDVIIEHKFCLIENQWLLVYVLFDLDFVVDIQNYKIYQPNEFFNIIPEHLKWMKIKSFCKMNNSHIITSIAGYQYDVRDEKNFKLKSGKSFQSNAFLNRHFIGATKDGSLFYSKSNQFIFKNNQCIKQFDNTCIEFLKILFNDRILIGYTDARKKFRIQMLNSDYSIERDFEFPAFISHVDELANGNMLFTLESFPVFIYADTNGSQITTMEFQKECLCYKKSLVIANDHVIFFCCHSMEVWE